MKVLKDNIGKPKIIAIDDNKVIRSFLNRFLSKSYDVTIYESTSEALDDLTKNTIHPDCILTDYYLDNDLTGPEFINRLKDIDVTAPVVVLSGSKDTNKKLECLKNGAVDFISKPFNPMELQIRIDNVLKNSPQSNSFRHAM